jgi:outer membrane autotransporter protein
VEGELHHTYQGIHGGAERQSRLGLINFSYDINGADEKFKPYVSFGAGISDQSLYRGGGYGPALQQDTALAAQVGAGFSLMLNQNLSFSGDYRYLTTHGNDMAIQPDDSHALRFGVTYMLPHKRMIDPKFRRD